MLRITKLETSRPGLPAHLQLRQSFAEFPQTREMGGCLYGKTMVLNRRETIGNGIEDSATGRPVRMRRVAAQNPVVRRNCDPSEPRIGWRIGAIRAALFFVVMLLAPAAAEDWAYIENGRLRLGVRKDAGACIGHLAGPDGRNVLDSWDHGRFVQQSFYGDEDGTLWGKKPWRYNPVQGGDWQGKAATVIEFRAERTSLYSKTRPRHWASGADVPEMTMEQWATLHGDVLHVRFRMEYKGEKTHAVRDQEIPAVFVKKEFATLVLNDGSGIRRWQPGWPNERVKLPEHWAAWLDAKGEGVGVYVPQADEATCYRFGDGSHASHCSYIAPLARFALTPGKVFEFHSWFTLGSEEQIRARFETLRKTREKSEAGAR
jgi:hypothetical protein